jgi:hypothetical protein
MGQTGLQTGGFYPPWVFALTAKVGLGARLNALFGHSTGANWIFMATLVIGFIHGWLKYWKTGVVTTFAFDVPLTAALALALLKQGSTGPWFPQQDIISDRLKVVCGIAIAYAIIPLGVPLLAALASFRAWVVVPLIYLLGYHTIRSIRQLQIVFALILVMSVGVAVYGVRQTPEEIRQMMAASPEMAMRLGGSFFGSESGDGVRKFSTFVSAAAFGGTMATGGIFAFGFLTEPGLKIWKRLLYAAVLGLCAYGIQLSGARTAIAMLATGMVLTAWGRGKLFSHALVPGVALAIIVSMGALLDPIMAERFSDLLDPAQIWGRIWIVVSPSASIFLDYPLGGGLGRSGHGVPWIFRNILPYWEIRGTDGDLGRIVADFGIVGVIAFWALLYTATKNAGQWMTRFRNTALHTMVLCAGANFTVAVLTVVTGSPFLGIPTGAISWFMLGAVSRLVKLHDDLQKQAPQAVWADPRLVPFGAVAPAVALGPEVGAEGQLAPVVVSPPRRRFLYAKASESGPAPVAVGRTQPLKKARVRRLFGNQPD